MMEKLYKHKNHVLQPLEWLKSKVIKFGTRKKGLS